MIAEKLGIVGRATEDGSLGWKLLLQHVADDAKGASGNLALGVARCPRHRRRRVLERVQPRGDRAALQRPRALVRVPWSPRLPRVAHPAQPMAHQTPTLRRTPQRTAQKTSRRPAETAVRGAPPTSPRPRSRERSMWLSVQSRLASTPLAGARPRPADTAGHRRIALPDEHPHRERA